MRLSGAGSVNTYAYVEGNPVSKTDPLGLFTSPMHGSITLEAGAGTGISQGQLWRAAIENMNFDFVPGGQLPEMANQHAMTRPPQQASQAQQYWDSFVNYQSGVVHDQGTRLGTARRAG